MMVKGLLLRFLPLLESRALDNATVCGQVLFAPGQA